MHISNHLCLETIRTNRTISTVEEHVPAYSGGIGLPEVDFRFGRNSLWTFLEPRGTISITKALRSSGVLVPESR